MSKQEFLTQLRKSLKGLPSDDVEERLAFYSEIIDDRLEEGLSEDEAVCSVGGVEEIASQIVGNIPLTKIAKERIKPKRRLKAWEIVLLVLGSPIWLSLGIAVLSVILAFYIAVWSVIIAFWAVFGSLAGCALGGIVSCGFFVAFGSTLTGIAMLGAGLVCAGLSVFMFYGCKIVTKAILIFTKTVVKAVKKCFIKKEEAE